MNELLVVERFTSFNVHQSQFRFRRKDEFPREIPEEKLFLVAHLTIALCTQEASLVDGRFMFGRENGSKRFYYNNGFLSLNYSLIIIKA